MPRSVRAVTPLENYKLLITFDNGEQRVYDVTPLLDLPIFQRLRDKQQFNKVYIDTVKKLFPREPVATTPAKTPPLPPQASQPANPAPPPAHAPPVPQNTAIYTVVNATPNNDHTIIDLWDGAKNIKAYYKGVAQLAKNQRITDTVLTSKQNGAVSYFILENYRIADYQQSPHAA